MIRVQIRRGAVGPLPRACYALPVGRSFAPAWLFRFLWPTQGGARAAARPLPSSLFPTASSPLGYNLLGFQPLGSALRGETNCS
jgi:hypothetical protein